MICSECGVNEVPDDMEEEDVCRECWSKEPRTIGVLDFEDNGKQHKYRDYYDDKVEQDDDYENDIDIDRFT